jgi:hypothetical protein
MCVNTRRVSDILLLVTTEVPRRALPYSWSWVSGSGASIENVVTLSACECGSHLYKPQNLDVYLYATGFEYEAAKMAWVNQGLWARSALPPGQGKCHCRWDESQAPLQLLASYTPYWRRIQHPSVTGYMLFNITLIPVGVSYAAPQAHIIVNVALHREYSRGTVFIFSQRRKDLYHV